MNCPRCKITLNTTKIRDKNYTIEVNQCSECSGIWFDKGELLRLDKVIEPTFFEIRKIPNKKKQLEALICPSCNNLQLMEKAEHPRDTKVIIDYCPICKGIWLDKGELKAIQRDNWLIVISKIFNWLVSND